MEDEHPQSATPKPILDGKVRLEPHVLKRLLIGRGWTLKDFCGETEMQMRTVKRIFAGERVQMATAREVAEEFGVDLLEIVDPAEYQPASLQTNSNECVGRGEWIPSKALTPVITAANGLQYRVYSMTHAFEPTRRGRGKLYEFKELGDEARGRLHHRLTRHLSVCSQIGPHPQFPTCYATFPDTDRDTWWVIDEWLSGLTLTEMLAKGKLKREIRLSFGKQLAEGIAAAHAHQVILREMSADNIVLTDNSQRVVLTDFELAKLTDDYPTVSRDEWLPNAYRAPEIGAGEAQHSADVYSWGRIMVHATLGELPAAGQESRLLKFLTEDDAWVALLQQCIDLVPSRRPQDIQIVRDAIAAIFKVQ